MADRACSRAGATALIDYKTSSSKPNGDVNTMQLAAYSLGATALGYEPDELQYRYEYLVKNAKPELVSRPVRVDEDDRRKFLNITSRVWKGIQAGIFYPNPGYLCGSCGHQKHCTEW
jgi:putative RecB family exonuclease